MNNYLVIPDNGNPFFTKWYEYENHWNPDEIMMIIYLPVKIFTIDGINWNEVETDEL